MLFNNLDQKTNKEFSSFGTKCLILVILLLIPFVLGIVAWFIEFVGYVNWGIQLIILVIVILAAVNFGFQLRSAGKALNNNDKLLGFRSKIIMATTLTLIGVIFIGVGILVIVAVVTRSNAGLDAAITAYITYGIVIFIGLILLNVAAILEIIAWGNLENCFKNNLTHD